MSEQSTPPKPKPGSLRDRIAAFEKPAAGSAPGPAPVPRPKPGGISWKPRQASPPASPSATDVSSERKAGGMSASDAKESIGKGVSLKERMAALQNRGAFGAPPAVAPKPALEKPKWKPPPVIAPVDKDEDDGPSSHAEPPKSPPLPKKLNVDKFLEDKGEEEESAPAVEGGDQAGTDAEEEERQRRAAIAARMARLGGAKVGMAPMFGSKPAVKKPEPAEEHAKLETAEAGSEEVKPSKDASPPAMTDDTMLVSPPLEKAPEELSSQPLETSEKTLMPERKDSASSSLLSAEPEVQQSRSPPMTMPVPSAPRRAAPPRKKTAKTPEIPPPVLKEQLVGSPDAVPTLDEPGILDTSAVVAESDKIAREGDLEQEIGEVDKEEVQLPGVALIDAPAVIAADVAREPAAKEPSDNDNAPEEAIIDEERPQHRGEEKPLDITAPSPSVEVPEAQARPPALETSDGEDLPAKVEEVKEAPSAQIVNEPEEDEEAARRQRIAEKLAKMGGVNPLAPPPQRRMSSSDDIQMSPPAKRASLSMERVASPPLPPHRRESVRKSSMASSTVSEDQPAEPTPLEPPSRKSTVDSTVSESLSRPKSQDDSWKISRDSETLAPPGIPEETERSDSAELRDVDTADRERSEINEDQIVTSEFKETERSGSANELFEHVGDVEPAPPAPPVPHLSTRPVSVSVVPVDPALPVDPVPLPLPSVEATPAPPPSPPVRSLPPPPRLVPQPSETEEEASESEGGYYPAPGVSSFPPSQEPSDDEDDEPPRRLPPRSIPTDDANEDEAAPLPVPNRTSFQSDSNEKASSRSSMRPFRSIPPPSTLSAPVSDVEQDSDFDEVLPTPPRHRPMTPGAPPTNEIPLIVPPPISDDATKKAEPSPLRQTSYPEPEPSVLVPETTRSGEASPSLLSPSLSVSDQEILDDEEGDPIDPSFHSPSRRTSTINLPPNIPTTAEPTTENEEDDQAARRHTIAERMAKLGGLKFGAAPLPPSMRPTPPPRREDEEASTPSADIVEEQTVEPSEEEEERARKERIAAKLAGMGGMRIGMLPLGVGAVRPQASRVLTEETAPGPPSRAVPPRPPPPPQSYESDADLEGSLSASQPSLGTSDEGVKVEAEESEIEEVSHSDAQEPEEEPEELPPPVPARGPRRRGTGSESEHMPATPPPRPPVPSSLPTRKPSVKTITSTKRKSSTDSSYSVKPATFKPQSEYVMVEEPSGFVPDEEVPPPPPARPSSRPPPRTAPPPPPPAVPLPASDTISSQWELPTITSSGLDFGGTTDLSLSWPEDLNSASSSVSTPAPPPPAKPVVQPVAPDPDLPRSSDELIAVWGRVGVQICEAATTLFDKSKKSLVGDGTYDGFVHAVLSEVPNATLPISPASYGYLVYMQTGNAVQKRASEIMPGDIMVLQDAKLKGHKGLQTYHQSVGVGEQLVGVVSEFEPKKSKVRLFQANQHVGQQTVEAVSYRLEDLKSGTVKASSIVSLPPKRCD
ncbi:hypothetical protein D9615_006705 [Tricholomella constricta]|uniref:BBC1/AIM3 cysteine proteinase-fold domain-containing protein n=1 Tax=Tricholomella constricta TaxID=117010 RepID=A0A8H5M2A2_9AGAR|nr:hypothetical protein D9615_006705 [Tricholomella constricta]